MNTHPWRASGALITQKQKAVMRRQRYVRNGSAQRAERRYRGVPEPPYPAPTHCECCGELPRMRPKGLVIDHDHATGAFRGWICTRCNLAIGAFRDCPKLLQAAITYLSRGKS